MTKTEYAAYLQSEHWQTFRRSQLEGAEDCERCEIPRWLAEIAYDQDFHVHHKHYATLGRETYLDIEIICRRCHEIETFGRSDLKAPKQAKCESCGLPHFNPRSSICKTCDDVFNTPWPWWASGTDMLCDTATAMGNLAIVKIKQCA